MTVKRLKKYAKFLKALHAASPKKRKQMLKQTKDREFICCVCEIAKNVLKGNVPLSMSQKSKLKRMKGSLRLLALKKTPVKKKKKIIQSGGFLGALLGPIVSILGGC